MYTTEKGIYLAILLAFGLLTLVLGFFVLTIIRHQRAKINTQMRQVNADIMVLEKERTRLAADLHDDIGASIVSVKMILHCMDYETDENNMLVKKAEEMIDQLLLKVKQVSYDLIPMVLEKHGLDAALSQMIANFHLEQKCVFRYRFNWPAVDKTVELHVFRIIQEILQNMLKHAAPTEASVTLTQSKGYYLLEATDNGNGFNSKKQIPVKQGLGLQNIMARTAILYGRIWLDSAPGNGTSITIKIPVAKWKQQTK